ncbi:hypothetical protein [Fuchsiella alkaliacetigena]|uniref:hypothetical protein n=1 Tax=Fuchsiella alkaliacetigena TaxID=957042 RepID=UPI00200A93FD|nr:hypothetical protein [Fuchsiella alkaliacetigena]MCK8825035.1 hypothetical protein [Fuchsiella alkaliacetigena]
MIISKKPKCEIHNVYIEALQDEVDELHKRINRVKERVSNLEEEYSKLEKRAGKRGVKMENIAGEFEKMEAKLDDLVKEMRSISDSFIDFRARSDPQNSSDEVITELAKKDNRPLLILIITLSAALLLSLGANLEDIIKLFSPL